MDKTVPEAHVHVVIKRYVSVPVIVRLIVHAPTAMTVATAGYNARVENVLSVKDAARKAAPEVLAFVV